MKLDTITLVETPEGIDLQAELVGIVPRTLAYIIDLIIRIAIMLVLAILLAFAGEAGAGVFLIAFFLLEWWYPVVYEVFRDGQTPGKKAFNIKVISDDLTPVRFGASLTRNLLRTADIFPSMYLVGGIAIASTQRFQRLGDIAAGTLVVYCREDSKTSSELGDMIPVPPMHSLNEEQQQAFINFTLNKGQISNARQQEIADILRPILPDKISSPDDYVRGVGKWLLGTASKLK
ncbi:MAG: RDD family protein [Gammaproteobacteria bacterium]|nr:RDD family protein [Gammaproteobacteria bacterium]